VADIRTTEEDTQLMFPRLCTTKHFTMTQLKLFTLVGVANLLLEVSPELLYGADPNCGVWNLNLSILHIFKSMI
jgi:hypothetical protein